MERAPSARVVIVGAGTAGLAAAQALQHLPVEVIVLEARSRTGGRICTETFDDASAVDMGAAWVHGATDANPITGLARACNAELITTDWEGDASFSVSVNGESEAISDIELERIEHIFQMTWQLHGRAQSHLHNMDPQGSDRSLWDLLQGLKSKKFKGFESLDDRERLLLIHRWRQEVEHDYAVPMEQLSGKYWDCDDEFKGDHKLWQDGYCHMINHIAKEVDVRLDHKVVQIIQLEEEEQHELGKGAGVEVRLSGGESITCDACICTLPLGVLQHVLKKETIAFIPALPSEKLASISRLGVGVMDKLALRFDSCFWDKASNEGDEPPYFCRHPVADALSHPEALETPFIINLRPATGSNVLVAYFVCETAKHMETLSDAEVVHRALCMITAMLPQAAQATLLEFKISRWHFDEFARGSYSCLPVGATMHDRKVLAEPVGRLLFAGEATSTKYPATVHGAYLSGGRAAAETALLLGLGDMANEAVESAIVSAESHI